MNPFGRTHSQGKRSGILKRYDDDWRWPDRGLIGVVGKDNKMPVGDLNVIKTGEMPPGD